MPLLADADPPGLPLVVSSEEAAAAGLTRGQVSHRVRSGRWIVLRPGLYLRDPAVPDDLSRFERERLDHVRAAVGAAMSHPGAAISHSSAAVVNGYGLITGIPREVTLTAAQRRPGLRSGVRLRAGNLAGDDLLEVDHALLSRVRGAASLAGCRVHVTSVSRTWVDVARTASLEDAVALGDNALNRRVVSLTELAERVESMSGHPGCRAAVRALGIIDGRRETPLESFSWVRFLAWGIPLPRMQCDLRDRFGFVGRVDFLWEEFGLIGEADGRLKYADPDVLWNEKRREDRLRALGFRVVRWSWSDLVGARPRLRYVLQPLLATAA